MDRHSPERPGGFIVLGEWAGILPGCRGGGKGSICIRMSDRHKTKTSRHLAILCLTAWDKERQAIQPYIESLIHSSALAGSDRHLAVMMVQGVLRQLQYLDYIIAGHAKHPLKKMKPLTLMTLRVGVYQLLFLDRVPDSAAVNETVKVMVEERQPRWMVNFVNGVLRNIGRQKDTLPGPDQAGEKDGTVLNHPEWLVHRWQERYGHEKTGQICRRNNREPVLVLRVNTRRCDAERLTGIFRKEGIAVRAGSYAPAALIVESHTGTVSGLPGYDQGFFHIQDEAAQLVTMLLGPFAGGGRHLDACAGLGGKTCQLAQLLPEEAEITAVEPNAHRFQLLQDNLKRLGLERKVRSFQGGVGDLAAHGPGLFHGILVDAPCSGTGVMGRHPDIRWNRSLQDLLSYQQRQLEILRQTVPLLRPGGVLVYATCSMEPEENEQVLDAFVTENPDFLPTNAADFLPGPAAGLVNQAGYFSPTPAEGLDGFFAARLVQAVR